MDLCEKCGHEMQVGNFPYCRGSASDHIIQTHRRFESVEVDLGKLGKHTVSSFADFARLEKMHLKATGQEIGFRAMNMEPSKQDCNSFGEGPQVRPQTRNRRGIPYITQRGGKYEGR